jgi:flagellar motor protein MotB
MKPLRVKLARRAMLLAGLGLIGVILAERPMQAAGPAQPLLRPTPLVLKDGRIANVSIHEVPFAHGQTELTAEAGAELSALTQSVGTDCFLTAQVIGHIDSSEIAEQDSLSAHRVARSRADTVQASLIDGGLPAKAIASVWDWQFMVREARATLWIFQLTAGEDCEGRPLREDLVAQADSAGQSAMPEASQAVVPAIAPVAPAPEQRASDPAPARETAAAEPGRKTAEAPARPTLSAGAPAEVGRESAEAPAEPPVSAIAPAEPAARQATAQPRRPQESAGSQKPAIMSAAAAAETQSAARPAEAKAPERAPEPMPSPPQAQGAPVRGDVPRVTQPLPTAQPKTATEPASRVVAAVAPDAATATPRAPKAAADDGKVEAGSEGVVITFATNSSYFPIGTAKRLRQLLAEVEAGKRYHVSVQVAVSGTTKVAGARSAKEAARYNRWLAERRVERVQQWLLENAAPDALSIEPEYRAKDESRQVVVRLAPVG